MEEYLSDGAEFWKKHNIHHPFLHTEYSGDGKKYHKVISKLNLKSEVADKIFTSFPATGMSSTNHKQFNEFLLSQENRNHLIELDKLLNDSTKHIFLFWGLINHLKFIHKNTGLFQNLSNIDKTRLIRTDLNKIENIYIHKHFSMGISAETLFKISIRVSEILK